MTTARYVALFLMACAERKKSVEVYDNSAQGPGCGVVCVRDRFMCLTSRISSFPALTFSVDLTVLSNTRSMLPAWQWEQACATTPTLNTDAPLSEHTHLLHHLLCENTLELGNVDNFVLNLSHLV